MSVLKVMPSCWVLLWLWLVVVHAAPPSRLPQAKMAASHHRQDRVLNVKPIKVFENVSLSRCLIMCMRHQSIDARCRSFNYGEDTCYLLDTYLCDATKENTLETKEGYGYYDLLDTPNEENEFRNSRSCRRVGRCSSKCPRYRLMSVPKRFEDARKACMKQGGVLATPKTDKQHEELVQIVRSREYERVWIGVKLRSNDTNEVTFVDGTDAEDGYHKWGTAQPNNSGGTQFCVEMLKELGYLWNDFDCQTPNPYICQYINP